MASTQSSVIVHIFILGRLEVYISDLICSRIVDLVSVTVNSVLFIVRKLRRVDSV